VAALQPQQQRVYLLKGEQGLNYDDVGIRLSISPESARQHLATAIKNITAHVRANIPVILIVLQLARILEKIFPSLPVLVRSAV
jgi:hypothetical protein